MKSLLQLKLGQQLTLTPQLQMAIRLLQLSTLELQQEIQQALDNNPMLERPDENASSTDEAAAVAVEQDTVAAISGESAREIDLQQANALPQELPVDTNWDDLYQDANFQYSGGGEEPVDFEAWVKPKQNLQQHLRWQLQIAPFNPIELAIASVIVDAIDEDGMLRISLEDIQASLGLTDIGLEQIEQVLKRVQDFDPPGIGARNIQESLLNQLQQLPQDTAWLAQALHIVKEHMDLLAKRDYQPLLRELKLTEDDFYHVLKLIQSLNPRPGSQISTTQAAEVVPDVLVKKSHERWIVELNHDALPKLGINKYYANMVDRSSKTVVGTYLRGQLQEARWFLKSLQSRHETLLKVATCIVERQQAFLEQGAVAMKPLVLRDIANELGMHESTISRVTTEKYLLTPQGVFELKYFFSSHISNDIGGECSATAVRAIMKDLIAAENPKKPLSDSKIAAILAARGIHIARRTVAKYREAMAIPPSNERKYLC